MLIGDIVKKMANAVINYTNIIINGIFNGTTGWGATGGASVSATANELSLTATANGGNTYQYINDGSGGTTVGHVYYAQIKIKSNSNLVKLKLSSTTVNHSGNGQYQTLSLIHTAALTGHSINIIDERTSGWDVVKIKEAMIVDLTLQGLNSHNLAWCDANLPFKP